VAPAVFDVRDAAAMDAALAQLPDVPWDRRPGQQCGVALGTAQAPRVNLDDWLRMIQTNIVGLVTITHRLLPTFIERRGAIIKLSSVAGSYSYPGGNVHGATKAFVRQFSFDLRSDHHGTGVRVTSIEPGMAWIGRGASSKRLSASATTSSSMSLPMSSADR
jgi:serine 3-dehydrogenase (NADP+)